jgi:hypothetical protein
MFCVPGNTFVVSGQHSPASASLDDQLRSVPPNVAIKNISDQQAAGINSSTDMEAFTANMDPVSGQPSQAQPLSHRSDFHNANPAINSAIYLFYIPNRVSSYV